MANEGPVLCGKYLLYPLALHLPQAGKWQAVVIVTRDRGDKKPDGADTTIPRCRIRNRFRPCPCYSTTRGAPRRTLCATGKCSLPDISRTFRCNVIVVRAATHLTPALGSRT